MQYFSFIKAKFIDKVCAYIHLHATVMAHGGE